jgi:hypothetical protein
MNLLTGFGLGLMVMAGGAVLFVVLLLRCGADKKQK